MTAETGPRRHVVILAAGQGTRMKSTKPKVLHPVAGRAMLEHVLAIAKGLNPATITVVVGHQGDAIRSACATDDPRLQFVIQNPQRGTAHALQQVEPVLAAETGTLVLLYADVPLLQAGTIERLLDTH